MKNSFLIVFFIIALSSKITFAENPIIKDHIVTHLTCEPGDNIVSSNYINLSELLVYEEIEGHDVYIKMPPVINCSEGLKTEIQKYIEGHKYDIYYKAYDNKISKAMRLNTVIPRPKPMEKEAFLIVFKQIHATDTAISILISKNSFVKNIRTSIVFDSILYDFSLEQPIKLQDIFKNRNDAFKELANFIREELYRQKNLQFDGGLHNDSKIETTTNIEKGNFAKSFTMIPGSSSKSIGLRFYFSIDQIGIATRNKITIDVPTKIFANQLKPEYENIFK